MNLRNLERVLAREEEVKRRAIVHKNVFNGPQIRYISQNGRDFYNACLANDTVFGHCILHAFSLVILVVVILHIVIC